MGYKGTREKSEQNLGKRLSNELNKSECDEMIKAAAEVTLQTKKRRWCGHLFMSRLKNQQRLCEQKNCACAGIGKAEQEQGSWPTCNVIELRGNILLYLIWWRLVQQW